MKKLLVLAVSICLVGFAVKAMAYDSDFELSGHINTGMGWQYNGKVYSGAYAGAFTEEGMLWPPDITNVAGKLQNKSTWLFYVGDVELDIAKTFGENIRLRADLDFGRMNSNSYQYSVNNIFEQAYATINIPVGAGLEFLVGRFNAPVGFEAVDNNDNDLPFHTLIFNFLRPQNLTGVKFYYPFSDLVDLHVWIANNLRDINSAPATSGSLGKLPAEGFRLGFTWGTEGQESTLGISAMMGSEAQRIGTKWDATSYLADLDFNIWLTDAFALGGEGLYRRDGAPKGQTSNIYYAGILNLHYVFSDVWDGTFRYCYANDAKGYANGAAPSQGYGQANLDPLAAATQYHRYAAGSALFGKGQDHSIDLGINYHIADGAKMMMMYRFEYVIPWAAGLARTEANLNKKAMVSTLAANLAYEF